MFQALDIVFLSKIVLASSDCVLRARAIAAPNRPVEAIPAKSARKAVRKCREISAH
jgi:hypothetical protein